MQNIFENLFPPTAERGEGNYDLFYQSLIKKDDDDFEYYVIYVLYNL